MQTGNISEYPGVELLREISARKLSGALRFERERAKIVTYFEQGSPIFAAANVRELRLGEYLVKSGHMTTGQLSELPKSISDTALVTTLTSTNAVPAKVLKDVLTKVVADTLRVALLWPDGTWQFDSRTRLAESVRVNFNVRNLLVECARKIAPKLVTARFTDTEEMISPETEVSEDVGLIPSEAFVLSRLDQPMSLSDLMAISGLAEPDVLRAIYCLALAGHVKRDAWSQVLKQTTATVPRPTKAPVSPQADVGPSDEEDLTAFLARIEVASDHYGVLDVSASTPLDEIKRAYYGLARRYHPDRFHRESAVHARIESAFARITQAYEVLTDSAQRANYDAKLVAQEKARHLADSAPKSHDPQRAAEEDAGEPALAERSFREGFAALQMGQIGAAITQLAVAAQAAPNESRYRAYYGQALAANARTQRTAESELQAAIRLEPRNASYHVMLAQLYYDLTFSRRAQAEVERALQLDPNNANATALLRKLEKK
ncbi:MAG TPA: DnaJ domain-containing protein [Pyrinomonadaceae bacterium]|nr:DnaJ domain-containing protein [Pyrinomonadaceae bacterium]